MRRQTEKKGGREAGSGRLMREGKGRGHTPLAVLRMPFSTECRM